jgi:hypothetical protein
MWMENMDGNSHPLCCILDCSNPATLVHTPRGRFWEYTHNYCAQCYEKLDNGDMLLRLDRDKICVTRILPPSLGDTLISADQQEACG